MNDSHSQTASCRVWLLGALRVEGETGVIEIPGGNAQSLFAYLILSPNIPHTRERLADLLWPDAPPDRTGRNLSDLLYRLRQALGEDWLEIRGDCIALRAGADLWVDVWEFERLAQSDDLADLEPAVALCTGDLLPEIYDDWILAHRVALEEGYFSVLLRLGQAAEGQNRLDKAFTHYHRLSHADPLNEIAHRGPMRVYARMGRYAASLEQ